MKSILRFHATLVRLCGKLSWLPPLVARVTLFAVFAPTGWGKLHNLTKVTSFFTELGIPWPHLSAWLVGASELFCGAFLLVGLLTRYATLPLIVDMAVALVTAKADQIKGPFDLFGQEEFLYIALLLWLFIAGAGVASIDGLVKRRASASTQS